MEGAILVATPALVRDFSPQLGRASAMGFWTVGPVAGSLITSIVAAHTLNHFLATGLDRVEEPVRDLRRHRRWWSSCSPSSS